jgi:Phosphodiesterase/alkaline phosphatase D
VSRCRPAVLLLSLAALAIAPASASADSAFKWGAAAGDVSSSSAILWSKAKAPGRYTVSWGTTRKLRDGHKTAQATKAHDNTMRATAGGLKPGKRYFFQWTHGTSRSDVGSFTTAPKPGASQTIRFAWSGDMDGTAAPGKTKPYWNDFGVLAQMAKEGNSFNVMLGDTIYSDTEVPGKEGKERAVTVAAKHAKYKLIRDQPNARRFMLAAGTYWHWDDHEFINDFSPAANEFDASGTGANVKLSGKELYKRGRQAFLDYSPAKYTSKLGLYRTARWGKNLEIFFLDERSFRSTESAQDCINPQSGEPDLAPTAPQSTRNLFSFLVPSLSAPVSQACLDSIRSPQRTFLGAVQWAQFQKDLKASTATWKVVMTEMEAKQYYTQPYDRWEGYESERQRLLNLASSVKNTVLLATDVHANLAVDARFQTLEDGGAKPSGVFEMSTGPVATKNFNLEISDATGNASAGDLVSAAFLKPPPPNGIGMDCAATKVFSYGEVTVTSTQLKLEPRDTDGKPVNQDDGTPCGPFTLTAR